MKKLIALLAAFLAFAGSIFAETPAFDKGNAYILDAESIPGTMKDHVKVVNVSSVNNFGITIYAYHENRGWIVFGEGRLYGLGDKQTIKSVDRYNIKLSSFRYLAIATNPDHQFKYSFVKDKNDLHIWFYDEKEINESHFKVFDTSLLPKYTDNFKLVGGASMKIAASFKIYAYNDESEENKANTIATLKGAKDSDVYSQTNTGKKFSEYRYIKIVSREERDFKYTVNVNHNDLIITVDNN